MSVILYGNRDSFELPRPKVNLHIKTKKLRQIKFRRKTFGGNIFGRFLQISVENLSDSFYNAVKNFGLKSCEKFGEMAFFMGQLIKFGMK